MCGTVAWLQVKPVEMMSNSTLPLGFLHSNTELVTCGQLFYFDSIYFMISTSLAEG
jgi:hypothetical protein